MLLSGQLSSNELPTLSPMCYLQTRTNLADALHFGLSSPLFLSRAVPRVLEAQSIRSSSFGRIIGGYLFILGSQDVEPWIIYNCLHELCSSFAVYC